MYKITKKNAGTNDAGQNQNISSCDETEIYSSLHFKFQNSEIFRHDEIDVQ
jgi:hypothetical protein